MGANNLRRKSPRRAEPANKPVGRDARKAPARDTVGRKYVYSIMLANEDARLEMPGIAVSPGEVHTVTHRDIAAVVSDASLDVYEPTRENMLAHERVNTALMSGETVLPVSFGTVFKTRDDILELLRGSYDVFRDVLENMREKVEFGVKVLWDRELTIQKLEASDEDLIRLRNEIEAQRGSSYLGRMQYGRLLDAALELRVERYKGEIFERLKAVSAAACAKKPVGDRMILNAACLVSREREIEFEATLEDIGKDYDDLTLKFSGPWPPYNFVDIRLKLGGR